MGHPSGSDGFQAWIKQNRRPARKHSRKNALAWTGQAENPPKPRMGIRLDASMLLIAVPVWQAPLPTRRIKCDLVCLHYDDGFNRPLARATFAEEMSRLRRSQAEKSARASWGHSVGFGCVQEMSQAWVGQAENPPKPCGDIRLVSYMLSVNSELDLLLTERPGLGRARRNTHPSRTGHSFDSVRNRLTFGRNTRHASSGNLFALVQCWPSNLFPFAASLFHDLC
jgi:hypothetical protein